MHQLFSQTRVSVFLAVVASLATSASADDIDVYLLGGQSNMQGIARTENLPEAIPAQFPNAFFYTGKSFEPIAVGKTKTSARPKEFGPEIGMAHELSSEQHPIALIKYFASGMPLHHGWNGNQWEGGPPRPSRRNFYPGQDESDPNQGTLYRQMVKKFQAGLDNLRQNGQTPVIRGFVWMQGEQDSKHEESASQYAANLKQLCARLREDLNMNQELAVVYGQVLPHEPALPRFTNRAEVRRQMQLADGEAGDSNRIPHAKMVSTDGFGLLPDAVHYNAAGQLKLGIEFGKALRELQLSR